MTHKDNTVLKDLIPCSIAQAWDLSLKLIGFFKKIESSENNNFHYHPANIYLSKSENQIHIDNNAIININEVPVEYLSPEETGRILSSPDYRSSYYRLGVILYELFTGRPPYHHKDRVKVIWQHIAQPVPVLNLEPKLKMVAQIISKLLQKTKDERYQSWEGFVYDWNIAYKIYEENVIPTDFILGSRDLSLHFQLSNVYVGRDLELSQINNFSKKIEDEQDKGLIMIVGPESSGKTSLLYNAINRAKDKKFLILQGDGKLDSLIPFQLFTQAFEDYLKWLQISDEKNFISTKNRISDVLGENLGVFTTLAPMWGKAFESFEKPMLLGQRETFYRLSYVISQVISTLSEYDNTPVFFVIDNLDFASEQSISLLASIMSEAQIKNFILCASFGDISSKNNSATIEEKMKLSSNSIQIEKIQLGGLNRGDIECLLEKSKINPSQIAPFTNVILQTTQGMPYLIKELTEKAFASSFITPDYDKNYWTVNVDQIKTIALPKNISEVNELKIQNLNSEELKLLKIASYLGMRFDSHILSAAFLDYNNHEVATIVKNLISKNIIVQNDEKYIFVNEKIYELVLNSVDKLDHKKYIEAIVDYYYTQQKYKESDSGLFNFLRYVIQLPVENILTFKEDLINGANIAKEQGAFTEAANYYSVLIDVKAYQSNSEKFDLQRNLVEMWIGNLNFKEYYPFREKLIAESDYSELQRGQMDVLHCRALSTDQKFNESVFYAIESIKKLGINIVKKPSLFRIIFGMVTSSMAIKKKSQAELENLPVITDFKSKIILDILQETTSSFFLTSPETLPEVLAIQIKLALKKGVSNKMAVAFATYGFSLSSFRKDFKKSEEMMSLAYKLSSRFNDGASMSVSRFLNFGLTRHWISPIKENSSVLLNNYNYSLEVGQLGIAYYSLGLHDLFMLFFGASLNNLQSKLIDHRKVCQDKKQSMIVDFQNIQLQFIEDMKSPLQKDDILEGSYFSLKKHKPILENTNQHTTLTVLYSIKGLYKMLTQNTEESYSQLLQIENNIKKAGLSSLSSIMGYIFYLIGTINDKTIDDSDLKKHLKSVEKWAEMAEFNFGGWHSLCQAVWNKRKIDKIQFFYHIEEAILWFEKYDVLYAIAYSKQLKIEFIKNNMDFEPSQNDIMETYQLYKKWGSDVLANPILQKFDLSPRYNTNTNSDLINLDINSIIQATTSIAKEIRFEQIAEKLTQILIENAGAQKVVIFQLFNGEWYEVAQKTSLENISVIKKPIHVHQHPVSLLRAVRNSKDFEIVDNINIYTSDPYLVSVQPKSALALPIIKNKEPVAIIYLENNLVKGAFTPDRLELIKMLSGQIAISFENSYLYRDLEDRVNQRTIELMSKNKEVEASYAQLQKTVKQLKETQNQLIISEKMASLGELTAGIAHEIQNPLNFVNNFSEVSGELIEEMNQEIEKQDFEEVKAIANDLKSNLDKITYHGKRADAIVKGMLQHSRTKSDQKEKLDINTLCDEYLKLAYHGLRAKDKSFNTAMDTLYSNELPEIEIARQDIGRVILNVITNAFHSVKQKSENNPDNYQPTISISTIKKDNNIEILISDNGVGIPEDIKNKIFQPFFTTKPTGQGTGLGLSMSYDIIKMHGGHIEIDSKEGEGATFTIRLPINN